MQDTHDLFVHNLPARIVPRIVQVDPMVAVRIRMVVKRRVACLFRKKDATDQKCSVLHAFGVAHVKLRIDVFSCAHQPHGAANGLDARRHQNGMIVAISR